MEVYLDNSATTACFPEVAKLMTQILCENYGNPSSMHRKGLEAEHYLKEAKDTFARILKVNTRELFFTSGGTEADNLALIGCAWANQRSGKHIITTKIEHPAVLEPLAYLEKQGFTITYLPVDEKGIIRLSELEAAITKETIIVSIMHTNNEIGSLQPIMEIGKLIKKVNPKCLFHVDAVQGFGKARIYPKKMNIDLLSASSHKIHGPKGVGLLYVGDKVKILPINFGGGQQRNLRSGTENVAGIAGMALAARMLYDKLDEEVIGLYELKEYFVDGLKKIADTQVNGYTDGRSAPHVISFSVKGIRSEVLLHALEDKGIYVSAGSACASNHPQTSKTLMAIGLDKSLWDSTIRFSMSVFTTREEIDYTLNTLYDMIPMLRKYTRH
ncbi:MAG: cysteine desulfurase [Lachnospiraceae bacterium]|nr:cysteine desulfurase [Lachnospiraceae bacterium]